MHVKLQSFPMAKVFKHLNTFSINALSENQARKRYSALPNSVLTLNCFSFAGNYCKQISGVAMGTRMGPSYANLFVGNFEHQFYNQYNGPKLELYGRYIDDCIGAISSSTEELNQFITSVNSFHPALKYTWEISEASLAFLDIKVSISGNGLCTSVHYKPTDSQLFVAHIHHMPRTPFLILNFLDFDVYVVMTLIFPANQRRCASSSKNVAILSLWSKRAFIAPNNLIDSQHYKRHKRIRMTEFHSPSLSILIITQSKVSFLITLNYSKMIPRLGESFLQPPLMSFKRDKNVGNFFS